MATDLVTSRIPDHAANPTPAACPLHVATSGRGRGGTSAAAHDRQAVKMALSHDSIKKCRAEREDAQAAPTTRLRPGTLRMSPSSADCTPSGVR